MERILIAGASTRAAAESAARAGFTVTAVDAFGDLDQHPSVLGLSPAGRFTAHAAVRAAQGVECDAVAYLSSFENHPRAISALAAGRALWGNPPDIVRRVRDPFLLADALRRRGFVATEARLKPDTRYVTDTNSKSYEVSGFSRTVNEWLMKPLASGGGHHIRRWDPGTPLPRGCYLQEFIEGWPGSVVFVAAGRRAVPIGVSRQIVGEEAFGATGYQYCGNILLSTGDPAFPNDETIVSAACALAGAVADEFGLVGVNGIDFIVRDGVPYAIEVNPRWSASMELVERAYGLSVLATHAAACASGTLPDFDLNRERSRVNAVGKAVVFARRDVVVGATDAWLPANDAGGGDTLRATVRDIPPPGEHIRGGRPVCTVYATGCDSRMCREALVGRAAQIYAQLDAWERGIA